MKKLILTISSVLTLMGSNAHAYMKCFYNPPRWGATVELESREHGLYMVSYYGTTRTHQKALYSVSSESTVGGNYVSWSLVKLADHSTFSSMPNGLTFDRVLEGRADIPKWTLHGLFENPVVFRHDQCVEIVKDLYPEI